MMATEGVYFWHEPDPGTFEIYSEGTSGTIGILTGYSTWSFTFYEDAAHLVRPSVWHILRCVAAVRLSCVSTQVRQILSDNIGAERPPVRPKAEAGS